MGTVDENTRGQDIPYKNLSGARQRALQAKVSVRRADPDVVKVIDYILPYMRKAVKTAEGNKRNFGILSVKTDSPEQADRALVESIQNNYLRWIEANKPGTFVDFMRDRYAPIGVENDPENRNINWNDNVRASLLRQLGPEVYTEWLRRRLAQASVNNVSYA